MKSPYVRDLPVNQTVTGVFLVHSKEIRQKKNGEPYLSLVLGDKTGEVDAKMWDNVAEVMETFDQDDFVRVRGVVTMYQNRPQLTVQTVVRVDEAEIDLSDFLPTSERDPKEMLSELRGLIATVRNPHLKALLEAVFGDPEIMGLYRMAPAAKRIHHARLGGLLEHTLSVCRMCRFAATHYKEIDGDLLVTGALLHDIGKIYELNFSRTVSYTTEGQLLGHIIIGIRIVEEKARTLPDFPPKLKALVEHMIASHHGELEFGSPKEPAFPEALLLHYLDDLDAKMDCMRRLIDEQSEEEGEWTGFCSPLERNVLKMDRYLEEPEKPAPVKEPPKAAVVEPGAVRAPRLTAFGEKLRSALEEAKSSKEK